MIRIVFAIVGSGLVRYALVSIGEMPKVLANMLTVLTFMTIVITVPPFMDAVGDIWLRAGINKVITYAERAVESITKTVRDITDAVQKIPPTTIQPGYCAAVRYESDGRSSYAWGSPLCAAVEGAALSQCSGCRGHISSRNTIALVTCEHNGWMNSFAGEGADWSSAEGAAMRSAHQHGFPRYSCTRKLILHPQQGKIG